MREVLWMLRKRKIFWVRLWRCHYDASRKSSFRL